METITKRIDDVTHIDAAHRGTILPPPKACKIELTARCGYRCSFCVKSVRENEGEMDRAFYSRLIRELHEAGVREAGMFFIGESMGCKWLPDAIKEAKDVGIEYVFLTTNGAQAIPSMVEKAMAAGLDSLKFSLNFADAEQLSKVANVHPRNFRRAIDNLKEAAAIKERGGYKTNLYASSIAFDGEQGIKMQAVVDEIKPYVTEHYFLPLYGMAGASAKAGWKPQPGNPGRLDALVPPMPCWSVFQETRVTVDKKLVACCFGVGVDGDFVMADLNEVSFMEGWNSEKYQALRAAHLAGDVSMTACAECAAGS